MNKFDLTQAILSDSDLLKDNDNLVIFKEDITDDNWFADGFLEASNLMIDTLIQRGSHSGDDILVFPILFNYVHSLEVSLKVYLKRLIEHSKESKCSSLKINQDFGKSLQNHDLRNLYNKIWELVNNDFVHNNKDFQDVERLILSIESFGITHESLRYFSLKDIAGNKLLSDQRWIDLKELHSIFNDSINFIMNSSHSKDFEFCKCGDIKAKEVKELQYIGELLLDVRGKIGKFKSSHKRTLNGMPSVQEVMEHQDFEQNLVKLIEQYNENTLYLINRGIRFGGSNPISVPNTSFFKGKPKEELIRHFSEKYHLIDEAIAVIDKHKGYIASKLSQRQNAEKKK